MLLLYHRVWNRYKAKSQHRNFTTEKKILSPLQPGILMYQVLAVLHHSEQTHCQHHAKDVTARSLRALDAKFGIV